MSFLNFIFIFPSDFTVLIIGIRTDFLIYEKSYYYEACNANFELSFELVCALFTLVLAENRKRGSEDIAYLSKEPFIFKFQQLHFKTFANSAK